MAYNAPIATLNELKARLSIGDTDDDSVLNEMLLAVSGAVEAAAGRPLRRRHCVRERFAGGNTTVRLSHFPLAAVHWVRESYDYDFDHADNYVELEAGTDYVLESGQTGETPGEGGWLRRLGGVFAGDQSEPGMVEVCYTGGYKTPGEASLENNSLTIDGTTNTPLADAFSVSQHYLAGERSGELARFMAADTGKAGVEYTDPRSYVNRAVVLFRPGNVLIPTWEIVEATLALYLSRTDGAVNVNLAVQILPWDPRTMLSRLSVAWDALSLVRDDPDAPGLIGEVVQGVAAGAQTFVLHADDNYRSGANMLLLNQVLRRGFLAFLITASNEAILSNPRAAGIATPRHATTGNRPSLVLVHRDSLNDPFGMPDDLKHATLVQTAHDWQIRRQPGFRQETQRGVSISSGVSYLRDPAHLLPEVLAIAQRYSRFV